MSFFFFKQKTAYEMRISDWSSDVCSSDLPGTATSPFERRVARKISKYSLRDSGRSVTTDTLPLTRPSMTKVRPVIRAASWMKARISASRTFSVYWADAGAGACGECGRTARQHQVRPVEPQAKPVGKRGEIGK